MASKASALRLAPALSLILAGCNGAGAPAGGQSPSSTSTSSAMPAAPGCTAQEFGNKAHVLASKFTFTATGAAYKKPDAGSAAPSWFVADLEKSWAIAPAPLQKRLCDLTYVFYDTISGFDWGFYEAIDQRDKFRVANKYVGIDPSLWWKLDANGSHALVSLTEHETSLNNSLLPTGSAALLKYAEAGAADTSSMALLSILSHEMGHIAWYAGPEWRDDCTIAGQQKVDFFYGSWDPVRIPDRFHDAGQSVAAPSLHASRAVPNYAQIVKRTTSRRAWKAAASNLLRWNVDELLQLGRPG